MTVEFHMVKQKICKIAAGHGWNHIKTQEWCYNFDKGEGDDRMTINVYWTKKTAMGWETNFTVQTSLNHPKKGKTQLNRKFVSMNLLEKIFENPRVHTHRKVRSYFKK
jgi:hypothetical protein